MRWRSARVPVLACLLAAAVATGATGATEAAAAALPAGTWGTAKPVTLPPVINFGQFATINSIACLTAGNCTAVGHFTDSGGNVAAIADTETNHTWAAAIQPFGTVEQLQSVPDLVGVSCSAPGTCSAVGVTTFKQEFTEAMILDQTNGVWHAATYVDEDEKGAQASSVSCPHGSVNACAAGGSYVDAGGSTQALLFDEQANGNWGALPPVPGLATLNAGGNAVISSVSCPSAGNCAAGGYYTSGGGRRQAFVVTEKNGVWGSAREVAATLNSGGHAQVNSISCESAGNCVAAGQYFRFVTPNVSTQAFEITEKNGSWSAAEEVPGTGALNADGLALVNSVSCAPAGGALNCALGGRYQDKNGHADAFVDVLRDGAWQSATEIAATPNLGGDAQVSTVSCPTAGNCAAGGYYLSAPGSGQRQQAFLASLEGFEWKPVEEVPGTAALNAGMTAQVNSVSCPTAGFCGAGGLYSTGHDGDTLPFRVDGSVTQPTATTLALSAGPVKYGAEQGEKIAVKVTPGYAGPATGSVTIAAGSTVLCRITLASGGGSCKLGAKQLAPGSHGLVARYTGATYFASSTSASKTLKVTG